MKQCPYCKSDIQDEATRCPHCTSILDGEQGPDAQAQVTYVLDRGLVRFLKFSGSVMAVFLIVGAFLYGFNLKEATEEIRKAQHESGELGVKMKETHLELLKTKEETVKLVQEAGTSANEIKQARDIAKRVNQETQILRASMQEIDKSVRSNRDNIMLDVETSRGLLLEIQGSREQARGSISEIERNREQSQTLLTQFGQPPSVLTSFGPEQAERLMETKLLKSFQNILAGDQYTKLEAAFKSAGLMELRRAIYDAENRGSLPGKLVRSEGEPPTDDPVVTQVYDNIETVHKFFNAAFGRNISGDIGGIIRVTVHYNQLYDNAFWNGQQLVVGDADGSIFKTQSFGSLSIMAVELSHPVIESSAGLPYMDQPGALHSHFTDVFSALTEQWQKNQTAAEASWLIGADILASGIKGFGLRSMRAPGTAYDDPNLGKDPQPDHISKYVKTTGDNGGVHINSGIPNRAFYEVAKAIGGHAWEKAGKIWYESMLKLKKNSTFNDCARTTYEVAGKLYGEGNPEQEAVRKGWETVGIVVRKGQKS